MKDKSSNPVQTVASSVDLNASAIARPTEYTSHSGMTDFLNFINTDFTSTTTPSPDTPEFRQFHLEVTGRQAVIGVISMLSKTFSDTDAAKALGEMSSLAPYVIKDRTN